MQINSYDEWEKHLKKFIVENQEIAFNKKYYDFMEYLNISMSDSELTNYTFIKMLYAFMFGLMIKENINKSEDH